MGLSIEIRGKAVFIGEPGACEAEVVDHPANQHISAQVVGEAVIHSMFMNNGGSDEY